MRNYLLKFFFVFVVLAICGVPVFGQVTTTGSLSGTVADPNGAVVPNATVVVKSAGGQEFTTQTNDSGEFRIPALSPGMYSATITAGNFKKTELTGIKIDVGQPSSIKVTLELGNPTETVTVSGAGGELLKTETQTVGTTITGRQITDLPYASRNALDLLLFLPGTNTVGRPRASTVNGLPKGLLNITMDGVNIQDNVLKGSDGFFTIIQPKTDAVAEVSSSTATPGADSSGQGAVQIKFVTRSGTPSFHGSLYYEHRDPSLNSNFFWNNELLAPNEFGRAPKTSLLLNQFGGRLGGPILIPKLFNGRKHKAFFFVNYEEYRLPESTLRTRLLLTPAAQSGLFTFGSTTVNVLALAGAAGLTSTTDPTISSLLAAIRTAAGQGSINPTTDPNVQSTTFANTGFQKRQFPTARFDFELTKKDHLEIIYNYQVFRSKVDFLNNADPAFPGFPNFGSQASNRYSFVTAWRRNIKQNIVNEARWGVQNGIVLFFPEATAATFANQGGFNLNITTAASGISNATAGGGGRFPAGNNAQRRNTPTYNFSDNLNWVRGKHTLNFGTDVTSVSTFLNNTINGTVPTASFAQDINDTAVENVFTPANGGAGADTLYRLLIGRVTSLAHAANLNEAGSAFSVDQLQVQRYRQREIGIYGQDSWKFRPNLTLNFGLRYELQYAPISQNSSLTQNTFAGLFGTSGTDFNALFKPGATGGSLTQFTALPKGQHLYNLDRRAWAPTFGFAWQPDFKHGFLGRLTGSAGQTVIRGGWSIAFDREGLNLTSSIVGANFGSTLELTQLAGAPNGFPRGTLLRNLTPASPATPAPPVFPLTPGVFDQAAANAFLPKLRTPYVISFSGSIQRELNKDTVLEIGYVGNRGHKLFRQFNLNEINTIENGFANEATLAQQNLLANVAAGRGTNFRFFGPGTGTSPLPIFLAYFSGSTDFNNPAVYGSSFFANAAFTTRLTPSNLQTVALGSLLNNPLNPFVTRAATAGLPSNFFIVNPQMALGGTFVVNNDGKSWYDAMTIELRRRLSRGLLVSANYTFGKSLNNAFASSSINFSQPATLRNTFLNKAFSPFDIRHAFKASYIYELPFGRGKKFFGNASRLLDEFVGGWTFDGTMRIQSGSDINLGNVQLVGMTRKEFEKAIKIIKDPNRIVFWLPPDIIDNSRRAFSGTCVPNTTNCNADGYLTTNISSRGLSIAGGTPTGRFIAPAGFRCNPIFTGACGFTTLIVHGPNFSRNDIAVGKKFRVTEKTNFEAQLQFLNVFNNINFRVGGFAQDAATIGSASNNTIPVPTFTSGSFGQLGGVETAYRDTSTTNDPGGRVWQIVLRFNF